VCANPEGIPPLFVSTGRDPLADVAELLGALPLSVEPSADESPLFAKAIAAMRRTTTPTTVMRLREEERPVRRGAPP
jgi:hypothetical protein